MELEKSARTLFPYSLVIGVGKFSGPCYFFTVADSDEFFTSIGMDGHRHPDGVYGWSMVLNKPLLQETPLPGRHIVMLNSQEAAHRIAQAVMHLQQLSENRP